MQKKSILTDIEILSELAVRVDYLLLQDRFSHFKNPKKKIFDLARKRYLLRVKRGQYFNLKSKKLNDTPYEVIANTLHFPSYVSLEWALQFYGLIPDRTMTVTSVTLRRAREFSTPYAVFSYEHINKRKYPIGYVVQSATSDISFLIARPDKALMDYISLRSKNLIIENPADIATFLKDDLRLNLKSFLEQVDLKGLQELTRYYHRNSREYRVLRWFIRKKNKGDDFE